MTSAFVVLGGTSGVLGIIATVIMIGRGIFKQVNATEELTRQVKALTESVNELQRTLAKHDVRISVLEDRVSRLCTCRYSVVRCGYRSVSVLLSSCWA